MRPYLLLMLIAVCGLLPPNFLAYHFAPRTGVAFAGPQQTAKPTYLSQFPSVERIKADVRGVDQMETAAKQAGIFWQLRQLISLLAYSQRRTDRQFTPDEQRLEVEYRNAYYYAMEPFEGKVSDADKPRWFELHTKFEMDLWLRDEVFKKYFTPELRMSVYVALKGQAPTDDSPAGSRLTSDSNQRAPTVASNTNEIDSVAESPATANSTSSSSAETYLSQGNKYLESEQYSQAAEVFKKALILKPSLADAHRGLGLSYYNLNQFSPALPEFQKAASLNPNDYKNHYWTGVVLAELAEAAAKESAGSGMYERVKLYRDATDSFEQAVKLKPDDLESQLRLGVCYVAVDMNEAAVDTLLRAVELSPNDVDANLYLGGAYVELGRKTEALAIYRKLLKLDKARAQELYEYIKKSK